MKEPIIVNESGSVDIFDSREKAERYLEPIDIENGEYEIYDSMGMLLEARVDKDERGIERVSLLDPDEPSLRAKEVADLLRVFLDRVGVSKRDVEEMDFAHLVKESLKYKSE